MNASIDDAELARAEHLVGEYLIELRNVRGRMLIRSRSVRPRRRRGGRRRRGRLLRRGRRLGGGDVAVAVARSLYERNSCVMIEVFKSAQDQDLV